MKKFYYLFSVIIFCALSGKGQYYQQYFDGADTSISTSVIINIDTSGTNVWQVGTPLKTIFYAASTVPSAIVTDLVSYYPINNSSSFRASVYNNFFPYGIFAFQWNQKLDFDTVYDGGIVEFSIDHGASWQNAFNNPFVYNFYGYQSTNFDTLITGEYAFTGTDTSWRNVWLCFDLSWMSLFPDTINFRFTMISDSIHGEKEGWMIDNMIASITMIHTVKNTEPTSYLNIYPNPATELLHIEAQKMMDFHIIERMELINDMGQTVKQWKNLPTKFWFDTREFEEGHYLLKIKTNLKTETLPLVICKK